MGNKTAVYIGLREGTNRKLIQAFLLPDGKKIFFKGVKSVFIGGTYECNGSTISNPPKRIEVEIKDNPEWERDDLAARSSRDTWRLEAKLKGESRPHLDKAVAALGPLVKGLTFWQKRALVDQLVSLAGEVKL
jgi:hypothetical protein